MDKSWMTIKNRLTSREYKQGVESFLQFAMANLGQAIEIRCPCIDCLNGTKHSIVVVKIHLIRKGIDSSYKTWVHHGEPGCQPQAHDDPNQCTGAEIGGQVPGNSNQLPNMLEQIFVGGLLDDDIDESPLNLGRGDLRSFDKLFDAAQRKAHPRCEKTVLTFIVEMLHVKVYKKLSNDAFNSIMNVINGLEPNYDEAIPWTIYEAKKFLRDLGLGYVPIHACINDCTLFWKENENMENCPECNEPRYKVTDGTGKKIPRKILRYLQLTPRLQRLYCCEKIAFDMRWHKDKRVDDDELRPPGNSTLGDPCFHPQLG